MRCVVAESGAYLAYVSIYDASKVQKELIGTIFRAGRELIVQTFKIFCTMEVKIQSVKFDASKQLIEFVEKKMSRLERFEGNSTGVDVTLKLDKDDEKGNKLALVTLHIPGGDIVSEQRARTFEEAVDLALDAVKRQIEKRRD